MATELGDLEIIINHHAGRRIAKEQQPVGLFLCLQRAARCGRTSDETRGGLGGGTATLRKMRLLQVRRTRLLAENPVAATQRGKEITEAAGRLSATEKQTALRLERKME